MKMNSKKIMALMGCAMLVMGMLAGCKSSAGEPGTAASTTAEGAAATTGVPVKRQAHPQKTAPGQQQT